MKDPQNLARRCGFTLLELLVAVAVFAVVAAMAYNGLRISLDSGHRSVAELARLERVQVAFATLGRDLRQAVPRPVRLEYGDREGAFLGRLAGTPVLSLTRGGRRNPLARARSSMVRVDYRLAQGVLFRDQWRSLDRAQDAKPRVRAMLEDVTTFSVKYMDSGRNWVSEWGNAREGGAVAIPAAVEVRLDTADMGELTRLFRLAG